MKRRSTQIFVLLFFACSYRAVSTERANIIVAQDGSGQFRSVQEALNALPEKNEHLVIILIKNGIYHEKVFITKSNIALVGEDRGSTQIVFAELRTNWTKAPNTRPDGTLDDADWGAAVVNIASGVTDITFANLTIHNNYGGLYGDHEHQFAVRGFDATRIIFVNCTVIADGGDTMSLWNRRSGMYYHADCCFEGWVDYVCPRGWCYITDSRFYGHNLSASIWHDGSANKDQKFVIRYSYFDGIPGFPLGRHHRDAQFYLLDCIFSRNMADKPIYLPVSPNAKKWVWGERHYFYNCHRERGDFDWFKDNLSTAEGSPTPEQITAEWTFDGKWNPEKDMPAVLPFVSLPFPRDAAYEAQDSAIALHWIAARNADSHNIYFGRNENPGFIRNQKADSFGLEKLAPQTRYYWRIDEVEGNDTLRGPLWHFTTK
ncbi:MAG: pectin esterase [Bacteroidota bacterium]|nr:pectin esterase [Bacteroidota bacterium]